jgi:hemoglobin
MPDFQADRGAIKIMVRTFYEKLLQDDVVGPYFVKQLGNDLNSGKWKAHFKRLEKFWFSLMNGVEEYKGDPMGAHFGIGELYEETFERWLEIFKAHVYEHFAPEIAEKFYTKSEMIAMRFMIELEIN